jgi:hypothetical protein
LFNKVQLKAGSLQWFYSNYFSVAVAWSTILNDELTQVHAV